MKGEVAAATEDFRYHQLRQVEQNLLPKLKDHAVEIFGEAAFDEAFDEYADGIDPDTAPEMPIEHPFLSWFFFSWTLDCHDETDILPSAPVDTTVAESYLQLKKGKLSSDEQLFLNCANRRPYSFYDIIEVNHGQGLTLRDILTERTYSIDDRSASQYVDPGMILHGSIMTIEKYHLLLSIIPYPLLPIAKSHIIKLKQWMKTNPEIDLITDEHLWEYEPEIRDLYWMILNEMYARRHPVLHNTDGDLMVMQKIHYSISSASVAFEKLKGLAGKNVSNDDLLNQAAFTKEGVLKSIEIPWLTSTHNKKMGGPTLLGTILIKGKKMTIEVNSNERAKKIKSLITKKMGEDAVYKTTEIISTEKMLEKALATPESGSQMPPEEMPLELKKELARMNKERWQQWLDESIPALNDMTPREASKTPDGRELLHALLLYYQQGNDASPDNPMAPDIDSLKKQLGLV
jgi:hypothetical protein